MLLNRKLRFAWALLPLLATLACARTTRDVTPPQAEALPPPPPEIATFVVPIRTSVTSLAPQIEQQVPARIRQTIRERGVDVEYDVIREPIRVRAAGQSIHASSTLRYHLQACRGRFPCVSCGIDEPRRTAEIRLQTALSWTSDWRLRSSTRVLPVDYETPCEITWFDIDVTRRFVAPAVDQALTAIASTIDRQMPRLANLRPQAETIWRTLQQPIEIAPRTWLVIEPGAASLTPVTGSGDTVATTLHLRATTRMALGERPRGALQPLAPLTEFTTGPQPRMRIPLDVELPYEEATRLARARYAGRTFQVRGRPLTVRSLRISPLSAGRLRIEMDVDYRGGALRNYEGPVVLEGTPQYDAASSQIVMHDLDYTLESRGGLLARLAERALHDEIRDRLRETARIDLAPRLAEARASVSRALQRQLASGVHLEGKVESLTVRDLVVHSDAFYVRLVLEGQALVTLR